MTGQERCPWLARDDEFIFNIRKLISDASAFHFIFLQGKVIYDLLHDTVRELGVIKCFTFTQNSIRNILLVYINRIKVML